MHHEDESEPALPVEKDLLADDESNEHHANQRALAVRLLAHARARRGLEHLVPCAQDFLQGMVDALMSGKTDDLPANLRILTELLEVCLAGTLDTERWVFLAHVVDAATAALFRLPNGMQQLRLMSGIVIELCLRTLEHIASDQTVDLRVRRLLGIDLAGVGRGMGWARCGVGQVRSQRWTVGLERAGQELSGVHWV